MKGRLFLMGVFVMILMSSCKTLGYQISRMTPIGNKSSDINSIVFDDEYCQVMYNLWSKGGNAGFSFYNKSSENIYVDLSESFFVKNLTSYDYFLNRTFVATTVKEDVVISGVPYEAGYSQKKAAVANNSVANGVSRVEPKIICIPPHTYRIISEYSISDDIYRDCTLLLKVKREKQERTVNFTEEETPLKFKNIISYRVGQSDKLHHIETPFYLSSVSNLCRKTVVGTRVNEFCGEKNNYETNFFRVYDASCFYHILPDTDFKY